MAKEELSKERARKLIKRDSGDDDCRRETERDSVFRQALCNPGGGRGAES